MNKPISETSFKEIMTMADAIKSQADIVPKDLLENPLKIACIIKAGCELGVEALTALRCISIVYGKVFVSYDLRVGILRKSGCKIRWKESTNEKAVVELWYEKDKSDLSSFDFTIEDAEKMGLLSKKCRRTGKVLTNTGWYTQPKVMLRARCLSGAARAFVGELAGSYDPCEMDEIKQGRIIEVEATDSQTGEERLLNALKAKNKPIEHDEPQTITQELESPSAAYIDFDILINDAVSEEELVLTAAKVKDDGNITKQERKMLRNAYMAKSNELKSGG